MVDEGKARRSAKSPEELEAYERIYGTERKKICIVCNKEYLYALKIMFTEEGKVCRHDSDVPPQKANKADIKLAEKSAEAMTKMLLQ